MQAITRKPVVQELLNQCIGAYENQGLSTCLTLTRSLILDKKIKFPLLEYCASTFHETLAYHEHITFCDQIQQFKTIGENVITGIILQKRLDTNFIESFDKAVEYLSQAHVWYICDIIGERVFGYGLRHYTEQAHPEIVKVANHPTNWVRRGLGAGVHYATKKGLDRENSLIIFRLLLKMANSKDKEIRQGVGWAAKTTAKFHPDIIEHFADQINDQEKVQNWFRRKIDIGLKRHGYAQRN